MGHPSIYPTGTTIYDKDRAENGFTIFPSAKGALLIDMNGQEVNLWAGLAGFPNKILPGGYVLGSTGTRTGRKTYQDNLDLVQVDWDGHIVWKFDGTEHFENDGDNPQNQARQHHDYQREGSPVGYYAPNLEPQVLSGNTLMLVHENILKPEISSHPLIDDKIIEVDWEGNLVWSWLASAHFEEYGFDADAKAAIRNNPGLKGEAGGDWFHINSASTLGPNKWYDQGDERFHPDNIIFDGRNTNILGIISKKTGEIVYRLGPNFRETPELAKLGWIIGQHHFHLIPKGLPGEGNFLVFDNGGSGGYGAPNPSSADGTNNAVRDYSRVLEFDPISLDVIWQYTPEECGNTLFTDGYKFYSPYISSAQRLANGNTLITEGSDGRLIEVTPEHEIVWEYINPHDAKLGEKFKLNMVYRAYRVPYEWVPQADKPNEVSISPIDSTKFRAHVAAENAETGKVTVVGNIDPRQVTVTGMAPEDVAAGRADFCAVSLDTEIRRK
ncbi:thioredoxin [Lactococcus hodotermopsidis]|uniref:Thioredoxin n=1 Tax=Pseudolactococcus hodotermopsidis TaxID=2709157 RepID=A0A6A0BHP3_9LACT|nr:aryl-sulfate sulfotransferase [Lactococcus hodotermopsidis]GFH43317.1 thioredoxin [Lactococcus hodotermopsidis]